VERRELTLPPVNADTTWLLQLPRPDRLAGSTSVGSRRQFFNVLFDPWLSGPQSDIASWFSKQWHVIEPALESIEEVEAFCRETESLAAGLNVADDQTQTEEKPPATHIDAIVISHEFTDHCHKATLLECDPSTPVIATTKAATLVKGWKHFKCVIETPKFQQDWRISRATIQEAARAAGGGVKEWPDWVSVGRVVTKSDKFYYHSAVMVLFDLDRPEESGNQAEAVIYTPHGIHPESLASLSSAKPSISTLALLHGLHDVSIDWGQQLNLGAHNGLAAQKALNARWWIGTHDEEKKGGGIVSWFLRRKKIPLQDAMGKVAEAEGESERKLQDVNFVDAESGQSLVLVDRA
jgi:hypothetical protein